MPDERITAPVRAIEVPMGFSGSAASAALGSYRDDVDERELIKSFVPTVRRLAAHLRGRLPQSVQLDDLVQAGLIALLRLARHSDVLQFPAALLRRSLVNAMIDEARRTAWVPVRTLRLAKAAAAAMREIKQCEGREARDEEVAARIGVTLDKYHQLLVDTAGIALFDVDACDETAEAALQISGDQEEQLRQSRLATALADAVAALPAREQLVLSLYYEHELNMEEIGEVIGVDKSTVSRSHGRALLMLRNALAEWGTTRSVTAAPRAGG